VSHRARRSFLGLLTALSAVYAWMAFRLDWLGPAGQLGPGYFPRMVATALLVGCAAAWARERAGSGRQAGPASPEPAAYGCDLALAVGAAAGFAALFTTAGPLVAMMVLLFAFLTWCRPAFPVANTVMAAVVPVALYVLFFRWLGTPAPEPVWRR